MPSLLKHLAGGALIPRNVNTNCLLGLELASLASGMEWDGISPAARLDW